MHRPTACADLTQEQFIRGLCLILFVKEMFVVHWLDSGVR